MSVPPRAPLDRSAFYQRRSEIVFLSQVGMNHTDFRCLEVSNFDTVDEEPSWTQSSSPWATSRECWWPLDSDDDRLCAFDSSFGDHKCEHDAQFMNESDFRWCGSNFDALGNRRFSGGLIEGVQWGAEDLTNNATFVEGLNWGYTTFDNIFVAFLSIFQSITLEGWSDILYQVRPPKKAPALRKHNAFHGRSRDTISRGRPEQNRKLGEICCCE